MEAVVELENVNKTYRARLGRRDGKALSGLSLRVFQRDVFGIVGTNGAGKSTALKILMGFVRPDSGSVSLAGYGPEDPASHAFVGYLPENPCLYRHLTLADHFSFAGTLAGYSRETTRARARELLQRVDLSHAANIPIRRFSKGMTQRAALAYAMFHRPDILILDEPMSGLDPLGRQIVVELIREYNDQGHTVLFCSHILTDVERICNRIGIMHQGRMVAEKTPKELREQENADSATGGGDVSPLESFFFRTVAADR
ncbi:ABC transporter ATP-binding protein [Desulfolithobacter sp.]